MGGWRGRIGCVYPAVVAEHIFTTLFRMMPEGVSLALRTTGVRDLNDYDLQRVTQDILDAADLLAERQVDIIIVAAAPVFNLAGPEAEADMIADIRSRTGIRATTTQSAAVEALETLGVSRVAVATPYDDPRNANMLAYLQRRGLEVPAIRGLSRRIKEMHAVPLDVSYRHIRDTLRAAAPVDGLYIPTMQFPIPPVPLLERDFGLPVVYATHALLWYAARYLGIRDVALAGHGRLLASLVPGDRS